MNRTEWDTYWTDFEAYAEQNDPGGLQRKRDELREEQRTVRKTISMLMEGIHKWEARYYELEAQIGDIDAEKDQVRDRQIQLVREVAR